MQETSAVSKHSMENCERSCAHKVPSIFSSERLRNDRMTEGQGKSRTAPHFQSNAINTEWIMIKLLLNINTSTVYFFQFCFASFDNLLAIFPKFKHPGLKVQKGSKIPVYRYVKWSLTFQDIENIMLTTINLSLVMRKPVFGVFDQATLKPAYAVTEAS